MLSAAKPLSLEEFESLFEEGDLPARDEFEKALNTLSDRCIREGRPVELKKVATGYRLQVKEVFSPWLSRLFEDKAGRYSRAFLETLAIIAYRQPATRGEIEDIRGVAVSSNIIKSLQERDWIQVVGHKEVPGRPALFSTTKIFLDYFGLGSLSDLPPLQDFIEHLDVQARPLDQQDIQETPDPLEDESQSDGLMNQLAGQSDLTSDLEHVER